MLHHHVCYNIMKIQIAVVLLTLTALVSAAITPPTPLCQPLPTVSFLPISLAETQRYDLEYLFNGYNLTFNASGPDFISLSPKFSRHNKSFEHSMNFTNTKVLGNGRFLGISTQNDTTILFVGMNDQSSGVTISKNVTVESISTTRCYDVDEVYTHNTSYAIIDCANFRNGVLWSNEFYFVDLVTWEVRESTKLTDVFVRYTSLNNRFIKFEYDFINNVSYLFRVVRMEDVDEQHRNQTFVEVFEISEGLNPYLIDVVDHTIFQQDTLSIADFKFYEGMFYLLDYNRGLFEMRYTRSQKVYIRSSFNIRNDVTRFSLNRLGVNDDLTVVFSNGNHLYEYNWIIPNTPILKYKYSLMPNSTVEHIFNNEHFVVVSAWSSVSGDKEPVTYRKIWVFSHLSTSYFNAYATFDISQTGAHHMMFNPHDANLVVFGNNQTHNFKFTLPFLIINPTRDGDVGKEVVLNITAISMEVNNTNTSPCSQQIAVAVINPNNMSVFGSGRTGRSKYVVDSPDDRHFYVGPYFWGPYLDYSLEFNTSIKPDYVVEKRIRSAVRWSSQSDSPIVFVDMFQFDDGTKSDNIYGLLQDLDNVTYLIECWSHPESVSVNCTTLVKKNLNRGAIKVISRVDGEDIYHRMAVTYKNQTNWVYIYKVEKGNITFVGSVNFNGVFDNQVSSMSISRNLLFVTFEVGKRVDVFRLEDIAAEVGVTPKPINSITSNVMRYFGVRYFAPMECLTSVYHSEVVFLKTKTGVMIMQVDEYGIPLLLDQIPIPTANYDMEISSDNILIIEQDSASLYQLQTPLVPNKHPFLLQEIKNQDFVLGKYSNLIADEFFYLVNDDNITVIHTDMPSNSIFYDKITANGKIIDIDPVRMGEREFLVVVDSTGLSCWELYITPKVKVAWGENQTDFEMNLQAKNNFSASNVSQLKFQVLNLSETKIIPTEKFDQQKKDKILAFPDPKQNVKDPKKNISFSDQGWFNGSVLHYKAECKSCGGDIHFLNHVYDQGDIIAAPYIYDIESGFNGIFIQQYEAVIKTHPNNSIAFQAMLPTNFLGQPCYKIVVPDHNLFTLSLCKMGDMDTMYTNLYVTSYITEKPFSFGPTKLGVKEVNKAQFAREVLMVVDVEDDVFSRQGGVYLYAYSYVVSDEDHFHLLDVIQSEDLMIDGFTGRAFISSADIREIGQNKYHLILTEAFSGGIFVKTFHLTSNRQEIIYESTVFVDIHKMFDDTILIPEPLRIATATIVEENVKANSSSYNVLLTVSNWHHIYVNFTIEGEKLVASRVIRLFERYPLTLVNSVKVKHPPHAFFAVPYKDKNNTRKIQFLVIYDLKDYQDNNQTYQASKDIPITPLLGAHYINSTFDVSFDFNETNRANHTGEQKYDNLLFVDIDSHNLTSLKINRNLTVLYDNDPGNQTLTLTAMNVFHNLTFTMDITFEPDHPEPNPHPEPDIDTIEIIWIVIMVAGFVIIVGLILICAYQIKKERLEKISVSQERSSLLTRDSNPLGVNRTTIDPEDTIRFSRTTEVFIQTEEITREQIVREQDLP